jgi:hypothetical protein
LKALNLERSAMTKVSVLGEAPKTDIASEL